MTLVVILLALEFGLFLGKTVPATTVTVDTRACLPAFASLPFCNTSLSTHDRVLDLIRRLRDEEKPPLLTAREGGGGSPGPPGNVSRIGLPEYDWGVNCVHGAQTSCVRDAQGALFCPTSFPNPVNLGATFNESLPESMGRVVSDELRALWLAGATEWSSWSGQPHAGLDCWSPNINLNRDPRWGRNVEVASEDPFVNGRYGVAYTRGLQTGEDPRYIKVISTIKHWDAYSLERGENVTRHNFNAIISNYTLQDSYFPAFKASVKDGNARGMMCSYNAINGVPTCASPFLAHVLRTVWGFDGYVTSDTGAISDIYLEHKYVDNAQEAACAAIHDGQVDINSGAVYHDALLDAVAAGLCSMDDVDKALYNTLKLRFDLGLFDPIEDQPYWKVPLSRVKTSDSVALSKLATLESLVLLKNTGVLPVAPKVKIAVIGPLATARSALVGNYFGQLCPDDSYNCIESIVEAISRFNVNGTTTASAGCAINSNNTSGFAAAVAAAQAADVVVFAMGIDGSIEAEDRDRSSIDLPGVQHQLIATVQSQSRKPSIVVLINGGMVAIAPEKAAANAIISAGYPGVYGGEAIAQTIFGLNDHLGGKLPYVVYPKEYTTQISLKEMEMHTGVGRGYRYYTGQPLYPFGYGLSLTNFTLQVAPVQRGSAVPIRLTTTQVFRAASDPVALNVTVRNVGQRTGDEVVFVFVKPINLPQQPKSKLIQKLVEYKRVHLLAGASVTIPLALPLSIFNLVDVDTGDIVATPGVFDLVLTNGVDQRILTHFSISGNQVVVEEFPKFLPGFV